MQTYKCVHAHKCTVIFLSSFALLFLLFFFNLKFYFWHYNVILTILPSLLCLHILLYTLPLSFKFMTSVFIIFYYNQLCRYIYTLKYNLLIMYTIAFIYDCSANCFALETHLACSPKRKHTYPAPRIPSCPRINCLSRWFSISILSWPLALSLFNVLC